MSPPQLMAVFPVLDVDAAREFYERLIGRPADNDPDRRMVWTLSDAAYIQVSHDALRAGSTRLGVFGRVLGLDQYSMDTVVAELGRRGVETELTDDRGVGRCHITDPDGNLITVAVDQRGPRH